MKNCDHFFNVLGIKVTTVLEEMNAAERVSVVITN